MSAGDVALVLLGVGLLVLVTVDLLTTVVSPGRGAGLMTAALSRLLLHLAGNPRGRRAEALGPVSLTATLVVWALMFTAGWWALLTTVPVVVPGEVEASALDRLAFTLTSVSSLGTGDIRPTGSVGRLLAAAASLSGLGLLTLSVTYALPVVTAVARRRVLARRLSSLGADAVDLLELLRDAHDPSRILAEVADEVRNVTQDHLSYPVLHHYRAEAREVSLAPNLAALDEAVTALDADEPARIDPATVRSLRAAITDLLTATEHHLEGHRTEAAPTWSEQLDPGDEDELDLDEHAQRRQRLAALVREDGWSWEDDVHPPTGGDRDPTADRATT